MSSQWSRFVTALETRGLSFDKVRLASDVRSIILATGITDPLDIAVIETEWCLRNEQHEKQQQQQNISSTVVGGGEDDQQRHNSSVVAPMGITLHGARNNDSLGNVASNAHAAGAGNLLYTNLQRYNGNLMNAPEEVQDTVVAIEVFGVLIGRCGELFTKNPETGTFIVTTVIPQSMRSVASKVLPVANAYHSLIEVAELEISGQSSVAMALGEVVDEICCAYVEEVGKLEKLSLGRSMPLMRLIADAQRIGYPIVRVSLLITEMKRKYGEILNGGKLLHYLYMQLMQATGSKEDQRIISLVLRRAAIPYLAILKLWMREGVLKDPFKEFFVVENISALEEPNPGLAFETRFEYKKDLVPGFINKDRMTKMSYVAGQYCCLLRECAGCLPPIAVNTEREPLIWTDADDLQRAVLKYYDSACGAVIKLLFNSQNDLLGRLNSLKKFFLLGKCDWLSDFLDTADEILRKPVKSVKAHTVQILLQSAIAKSSTSANPHHTTIGCSFSNYTIDQYVESVITDSSEIPNMDSSELNSLRCIELLQLDVDYLWPQTLIITPLVVKQFNLIFRLLMWLNVSERNLHESWPVKQRNRLPPLAVSLKQMMLQFVRQFQFYASHFVLERLWSKMILKVSQADSVFVISQAIENFCSAVDLELVLASPHRFRKLSKMLNLVLEFCSVGAQSGIYNSVKVNDKIKQLRRSFLLGLSELANPKGPDYPHLMPLLTWIDFSRFYEMRQIFKVQHSLSAFLQSPTTNKPMLDTIALPQRAISSSSDGVLLKEGTQSTPQSLPSKDEVTRDMISTPVTGTANSANPFANRLLTVGSGGSTSSRFGMNTAALPVATKESKVGSITGGR